MYQSIPDTIVQLRFFRTSGSIESKRDDMRFAGPEKISSGKTLTAVGIRSIQAVGPAGESQSPPWVTLL
jgi:hypothetical protein